MVTCCFRGIRSVNFHHLFSFLVLFFRIDMVVVQLPNPKALNTDKIEQLMCNKNRRFDTLLPETQRLKQGKFLIELY